jgi:hypothetical protein
MAQLFDSYMMMMVSISKFLPPVIFLKILTLKLIQDVTVLHYINVLYQNLSCNVTCGAFVTFITWLNGQSLVEVRPVVPGLCADTQILYIHPFYISKYL